MGTGSRDWRFNVPALRRRRTETAFNENAGARHPPPAGGYQDSQSHFELTKSIWMCLTQGSFA